MIDILSIARSVIYEEARAIDDLEIGREFKKAVIKMYGCTRLVATTGIGKSGHIARKIAATLTSTGTPSLYIHPAESLHGDIGIIGGSDILLIISKSGETEEILKMLPIVKILNIPIIAILECLDSSIGRIADIVLNASVGREADMLNLVPTSSTTAALVLGDALAVTLMELRGFKPKDYAFYHPGGSPMED